MKPLTCTDTGHSAVVARTIRVAAARLTIAALIRTRASAVHVSLVAVQLSVATARLCDSIAVRPGPIKRLSTSHLPAQVSDPEQTPLLQSESAKHESPGRHLTHLPPPQSTSVSTSFWTASEQVGSKIGSTC